MIVAAQSLGETLFTSSEYSSLSTSNAQFVTDLYAGYLGRVPDGYGGPAWLAALNSGTSRTDVRHGFAYSAEFQNDVGQLCVTTSSTSASLKYVLSDVQGTTRAVMNNNGSPSAIVARHDYLPFGEELWAGIGLRTTTQTYGATDAIRGKYGLTERDDATGLDHTWFRKYESFSGRWTSPDPLKGTISDPQSFNGYSYTQSDPVNFVDPTGLDEWVGEGDIIKVWTWAPHWPRGGGGGQGLRHGPLLDIGDEGGGGGGPSVGQKPKGNTTPVKPSPPIIPRIIDQVNHILALKHAADMKFCREYMRNWWALHTFFSPGPGLITGFYCGMNTPY
jgi:RHS repeat-associated protein